ncbi:MAG: hypothetical protein ACKO0Z_27790 [Betaproteobacteria bacterium]
MTNREPEYRIHFHTTDVFNDAFHQIKTSQPPVIQVGHYLHGEIREAYNRNRLYQLLDTDRLIVKAISHWIPESQEIQDAQDVEVVVDVVHEV